MKQPVRPFLERPLRLALLGALLLLATAAGLAAFRHQALVGALAQESLDLHRLISQRADQHDAHMTALSAVATASDGVRQDLFLEMVATISRFYARIDEVQLVPLDPAAAIIGSAPLDPAMAEHIRAAARGSEGRMVLLPRADRPDHYAMIKRSPNSDAARYGLMLGIDAPKLIGEAGPFWARPGVTVTLSMPGGGRLAGEATRPETLRFARALGSASQPLLLETGMSVGLRELLPPVQTGLALIAVALACLAGIAALRQRARTRAAIEQARLSELDSRLAHASRVNALGEMASGLAHELTQPLTAILAGAQAGRRLIGKGDTEALAPVLEDTVTQARRASAILARFRDWSRPQAQPVAAFDLREALRTVQALLGPQAASRGARLELETPPEPVPVIADPVEMEQVAFNLVRNAIEAVGETTGAGVVSIRLREERDRVVLDIADNGPGVAAELRPRLFTPFTTTRAEGTGLGLALSQRLVERAGGDIALLDDAPGATFRIVLPRAANPTEAA